MLHTYTDQKVCRPFYEQAFSHLLRILAPTVDEGTDQLSYSCTLFVGGAEMDSKAVKKVLPSIEKLLEPIRGAIAQIEDDDEDDE